MTSIWRNSGVDCEAGGDVLAGVQGQYALPIPIDCDVTLIAGASGYKGRVYTDDENPSRPVLRLAAGQRKIPDIQLETTGDQYASYGFALAARVGGSAFGKRGGLPPKENTGECPNGQVSSCRVIL